MCIRDRIVALDALHADGVGSAYKGVIIGLFDALNNESGWDSFGFRRAVLMV